MDHQYSIILTFACDNGLRQLDDFRKDVAGVFGGGTTFALPPHITMVRWRATSNIADVVLGSRPDGAAPLDLVVVLGPPQISPDRTAVWWPVVSNAAHRLRSSLTKAVAKGGGYIDQTRRLLHVTLAYRDYSRAETEDILHYAIENGPGALSLRATDLVGCVRDLNGAWTLIHPDIRSS